MTPYRNCYVLVDYDNVAKQVFQCDVPALNDLAGWLEREILPEFIGTDPLRIITRLYGGWNDDSGRETSRASVIRQQLSRSGILTSGRRTFDFQLINQAACREGYITLYGTSRRPPNPPPFTEQKMVDSLLVVDLLRIAELPSRNLVLLCSEDRDFAPGLLYASQYETPDLVWVKIRNSFPGANLRAKFEEIGVRILELEPGPGRM
jgi:hypothetical protein